MITNDQVDKLKYILTAVKANTEKLSDWELNFCSDIEIQFARYNCNINMSTKQWAVLNKVYEKSTSVTKEWYAN